MDNKKGKTTHYPSSQVMNIFLGFGGIIGGIITAIMIIIVSIIDMGSIGIEAVFGILLMLLVSSTLGLILGFLPALFSAYIICKFEIYFDTVAKAIPLFAIGYFSVFVFLVWLPFDDYLLGKMAAIAPICAIGGTSAVITGWLVLPKQK